MSPHTTIDGRPPPGYTLVELLVVIVIVTILLALSLGGLFAAQRRARVAATRSTIRKLHEIVVPMYEAYAERRVPIVGASTAAREADRLAKLRRIAVHEMPDTWADVPDDPAVLPAYCQTTPVRAFAARKAALPAAAFAENGAAECLYMIVARSGLDADALEHFRAEEIGDYDQDGAPEFQDGWGRPIAFIRWATGHASIFQNVCAARLDGRRTFVLDGAPRAVDRFRASSNVGVWGAERLATRVWGTGITPEDLGRFPEGGTSVATVDAAAEPPTVTMKTDAIPANDQNRTLLVLEATSDPLDRRKTNGSGFPVVPLVYSAGPAGAAWPQDPSRGYGLVTRDAGWGGLADAALADIFVITAGDRFPGEPLRDSPEACRDNVTNHDPFMAGN